MTFLDHLLRSWRIAQAKRFVPAGAMLLDVGCGDGTLFRSLNRRVRGGVGIEPTLPQHRTDGPFKLIRGTFPEGVPTKEPFDAITMLAVLEHIPDSDWSKLREACARLLKPGGLLILTVPSPRVDTILAVLKRFRLVDGMALHEHHGYDVRKTPEIFCSPYFELFRHSCFQLGLNHLFVFVRKNIASEDEASSSSISLAGAH